MEALVQLKPGALITPRLRLVRPIGRGGMGAVWVAHHLTLRTQVAMKFADPRLVNGGASLARFEREAAIAAQLRSPHVAYTYDHGRLDSGVPYIVMELLEGESLQARLRRGSLSLQQTALLVSQTARALSRAHRLGIIHRDVKPANLFLLDADYAIFVKLLDFGIAKMRCPGDGLELTNTGHLLGSPRYMSPEQLSDIKNIDGRADVWALAAVAYRCLAGAPAFRGEALGNVIMAVMSRDYLPISRVRSDLPATLDDWFATAFHPNIDRRFPSVKVLADALLAIARTAASNTREVLPSLTEESELFCPPPMTEKMPAATPSETHGATVSLAASSRDATRTLEPATSDVGLVTATQRRGRRHAAAAAAPMAVVMGGSPPTPPPPAMRTRRHRRARRCCRPCRRLPRVGIARSGARRFARCCKPSATAAPKWPCVLPRSRPQPATR